MPRIEHQEGKSDGGDPGVWTNHAERDAAHHDQNHGDRVPPCPYQSHDHRNQQDHLVLRGDGNGPDLVRRDTRGQ